MDIFGELKFRELGLVGLFCLLLIGADSARAQGLESQSVDFNSQPQSHPHFQHTFQIAGGLHRFDYKEDIPAPKKSTESGVLPSAVLGYRYEEEPRGMLYLVRMEGTLPVSTQYVGTDMSGEIPISDTTRNLFYELEAEIASPALEVHKTTGLRAYVGGGYHYWQRGVGATSVGGYREDYHWPLIIGGMLLSMQPLNHLSLDLDLSARWQVNGAMKVYLSQISKRFQDATVSLGDRMGFKAQLPINYRIYGNASLLVSPWAEFSSIGESQFVPILTPEGSETGLGFNEPSSRTIQYGSLVGLSFGI
jgi:hypothetical protein